MAFALYHTAGGGSNNTKFHVNHFNCRWPFSAPKTLMCIFFFPNFMENAKRFLVYDLCLIQKYNTTLCVFLQKNQFLN